MRLSLFLNSFHVVVLVFCVSPAVNAQDKKAEPPEGEAKDENNDEVLDRMRNSSATYDIQFLIQAVGILQQDPALSRELELTKEQLSSLKEFSKSYYAETQILMGDYQSRIIKLKSESKDEQAEDLQKELRSKVSAIQRNAATKLESIFVPHQIDRLRAYPKTDVF